MGLLKLVFWTCRCRFPVVSRLWAEGLKGLRGQGWFGFEEEKNGSRPSEAETRSEAGRRGKAMLTTREDE